MSGMHRGTLRIPYTSRDFPHGMVRSRGSLPTTWDDLLWAALTVGRPNTAYVFRHGDASYYEAVFRLSLVRMALEQQCLSESLFRTEAFRSLDPTEKGAVSYFLGMAVCKLFASRLLGTPWLLHLDVFRDQLDPALSLGRSRPDLVGQDGTGEWHAFESKGRSTVPTAEDKQKAKAQAQRLVCVNSTNCSLHVGAISYFWHDELKFHWRDPDPDVPETLKPIAVCLPKDAWRFYYEPALALVADKDAESVVLREARTAIDVEVGVHCEIRALLLEGAWAAARLRANELEDTLRDEGYQADGLRVVCGDSWQLDGRRRLLDQ